MATRLEAALRGAHLATSLLAGPSEKDAVLVTLAVGLARNGVAVGEAGAGGGVVLATAGGSAFGGVGGGGPALLDTLGGHGVPAAQISDGIALNLGGDIGAGGGAGTSSGVHGTVGVGRAEVGVGTVLSLARAIAGTGISPTAAAVAAAGGGVSRVALRLAVHDGGVPHAVGRGVARSLGGELSAAALLARTSSPHASSVGGTGSLGVGGGAALAADSINVVPAALGISGTGVAAGVLILAALVAGARVDGAHGALSTLLGGALGAVLDTLVSVDVVGALGIGVAVLLRGVALLAGEGAGRTSPEAVDVRLAVGGGHAVGACNPTLQIVGVPGAHGGGVTGSLGGEQVAGIAAA